MNVESSSLRHEQKTERLERWGAIVEKAAARYGHDATIEHIVYADDEFKCVFGWGDRFLEFRIQDKKSASVLVATGELYKRGNADNQRKTGSATTLLKMCAEAIQLFSQDTQKPCAFTLSTSNEKLKQLLQSPDKAQEILGGEWDSTSIAGNFLHAHKTFHPQTKSDEIHTL